MLCFVAYCTPIIEYHAELVRVAMVLEKWEGCVHLTSRISFHFTGAHQGSVVQKPLESSPVATIHKGTLVLYN